MQKKKAKLSQRAYRRHYSSGFPYDFDEETYRIDEAIENTNRLENCLKEIRNTQLFSKVQPDIGEDYEEDKYLVKGFRTYIAVDIIKDEDFPQDRIADVKPFIWKYRNESDLQ